MSDVANLRVKLVGVVAKVLHTRLRMTGKVMHCSWNAARIQKMKISDGAGSNTTNSSANLCVMDLSVYDRWAPISYHRVPISGTAVYLISRATNHFDFFFTLFLCYPQPGQGLRRQGVGEGAGPCGLRNRQGRGGGNFYA